MILGMITVITHDENTLGAMEEQVLDDYDENTLGAIVLDDYDDE